MNSCRAWLWFSLYVYLSATVVIRYRTACYWLYICTYTYSYPLFVTLAMSDNNQYRIGERVEGTQSS